MEPIVGRRRWSLTIAAVLLVAACSPLPRGTIIDGWQIADQPQFEANPSCDRRAQYLDVGVAALAERFPGHPPIVESFLFSQMHEEPRSGGHLYVAVFHLADGTYHAIGVANLGIGPVVPFDPPNIVWPGHNDPPPEVGPCGPQPANP